MASAAGGKCAIFLVWLFVCSTMADTYIHTLFRRTADWVLVYIILSSCVLFSWGFMLGLSRLFDILPLNE